METNEHKPRRDFLKVISVSLAVMSAFPFVKFDKAHKHPEQHFNTLSKSEADEIIRKEKFPVPKPVTPAPPPSGKRNITH